MANLGRLHADRLELERGLTVDDILRGPGPRRLAGRRSRSPRGLFNALGTDRRPPGTHGPRRAGSAIPAGAFSPVQEAPANPPAESLPDFEEVQPSIETIVPPPKRREPTLLPDSSSSDVAFPVIEQDLAPRAPRKSGQPVPPPPAWTWNDDEEEEDEDQDEDEDEDEDPVDQGDSYIVLDDQDDIEILAEEGDLAAAERDQEQPPAAPSRRKGDPFAYRIRSRPRARPRGVR